MKRIPFVLKLGLAALAVVLIGFVAATLALKIWLPPEKLRGLIVAQAQKALKREVRLKDISLGVLKGLSLDGLEVSESPDFAAGTFASVDSFRLKIRLLPLLHRKVVVDRIAVSGLTLNVLKRRDGRFNFDDLIASPAPAKGKPAPAKPQPASGAPLPFDLAVKRASLTGGILYRDAATGAQWRVAGMEAAVSDVSLASGASATIDKLAADVSGLRLEASGRIRAQADGLEVPLKGRLGDGSFDLSLAVKDYPKAPEVDLQANLSLLDAGKLMALSQGGGAASKGNATPPAAPGPKGTLPAGPPMKARGAVTIGRLIYGGTTADNLSLKWDLKAITPELKDLGGWAKLNGSGVGFTGEAGAGRSGVFKALMLPITILKQIGSILGKLRIFPDLEHMVFTEIVGDYVFQRGVMTLRDFHMNGAAANMKTTGSVDLAAQRLNLLVTLELAKVAPISVEVGGTFDSPQIRPKLTQALTGGVQKAAESAKKLFKSIFK